MTGMGPIDRKPDESRETAAGARAWTKPVLVEYGHLAKLTRGPSGSKNEPIDFIQPPPMCL